MIDYLKRGVLAGGVAGGAYGLFIALVANPLIERIHELQHDHSHAAGESTAIVSESTTNIVSVGGGLLWGIFLGGLFALAFFLLEPAVPGRRAVKPYLLAGLGFLTVSGMPWLVLPPATPASEQLYSVDARLAVYGGLVLVGAAISAAAVELYRRTASQHKLLRIAAGAVPIGGTIILLSLLAPTTVTHSGLSTDLIVTYQAMVGVGQAAIWLLIASTFGWLQRRDTATSSQSTEPTPTESA
jgi:hypothetical protein